MRAIISFLIAVCLLITDQGFAQTLTKGTITYDAEVASKMRMGNDDLEQRMSMSIAMEFSGEHYRLAAVLGGGGGASIPGTGIHLSDVPKMYQYYVPKDKFMYQYRQLRNKSYAVRGVSRSLTKFVETGKTDTLFGYACHEFTCVYNDQAATGWYSKDIAAHLSPVGPLGLPGALLLLESKSYKYKATSVSATLSAKEGDLKLPGDAVKMTNDEFMKEMANPQG